MTDLRVSSDGVWPPIILKWLYTGLSLCIAILVYLGTGLGRHKLISGEGHSLAILYTTDL